MAKTTNQTPCAMAPKCVEPAAVTYTLQDADKPANGFTRAYCVHHANQGLDVEGACDRCRHDVTEHVGVRECVACECPALRQGPDTATAVEAGPVNLPMVLGLVARERDVTLRDLDDALGEPGAALAILAARRSAKLSKLASLAGGLDQPLSVLLGRAEAAGAVDWRTVTEGGQLVEVWHAADPDGDAVDVLLGQWLDTDPEGQSLAGVQPIVNGSGRHIGERYVLTVAAAQGLRDALAASQAATEAEA